MQQFTIAFSQPTCPSSRNCLPSSLTRLVPGNRRHILPIELIYLPIPSSLLLCLSLPLSLTVGVQHPYVQFVILFFSKTVIPNDSSKIHWLVPHFSEFILYIYRQTNQYIFFLSHQMAMALSLFARIDIFGLIYICIMPIVGNAKKDCNNS